MTCSVWYVAGGVYDGGLIIVLVSIKPTIPIVYRTPAILGVVPILVLLIVCYGGFQSCQAIFTGAIPAIGTIQPAP